MIPIIPLSRLFTCIRIAILAEMRAGIIFAYILALYAATELALAFVAVVAMSGVGAIGEEDCIGGKWGGIAKEVGNGRGVNGDLQKVHQGFVFIGKADDKLVVYATILHDAKLL